MHNSPPPPPRTFDTAREAEQLAEEWMRYWGYRDAQMTPVGPDGGLDVVAENAVAQVKYYAAQIGRPTLQEFFGAGYGHAGHLLFFTTSAYAMPALQYADQVGMALFVIEPFGRMRPVNEAAVQVAAREEERNSEEARERAWEEAYAASKRRRLAEKQERERGHGKRVMSCINADY